MTDSQATTPKSNTVLCIDDDQNLQDLLQAALSLAGYNVTIATDGAQGIERAVADQPQVIILDVMLPDLHGYQVLSQLRRHPRTSMIPVIFLSALDRTEDRVHGLERGADDYIGKPFAVKELLARVRTQIRHAEEHLLSDLTGLPGNTQIQRWLQQELAVGGADLHILYIDIDNFKSFNDAYGFLRGNELIKLTASILSSNAMISSQDSLLGHVGGDDFVLILRQSREEIVKLCEVILRQFDEQAPQLYDPDDRARGYVEAFDRRNIKLRFPLVTLSIAVVSNERRVVEDEWMASSIAADLKKLAKRSGHSSYHFDQRGT